MRLQPGERQQEGCRIEKDTVQPKAQASTLWTGCYSACHHCYCRWCSRARRHLPLLSPLPETLGAAWLLLVAWSEQTREPHAVPW